MVSVQKPLEEDRKQERLVARSSLRSGSTLEDMLRPYVYDVSCGQSTESLDRGPLPRDKTSV
jgi:hypothetical protein